MQREPKIVGRQDDQTIDKKAIKPNKLIIR